MHILSRTILFFFLGSLLINAHAQTARKPSYYENKAKKTTYQQPSTKNTTAKRLHTPYQLAQIKTKNEFTALARTYELGTLYEIPHVLFLIDLKDKQRMYYINTPLFQLHENFIKQALNQKGISRAQLNINYTQPNRRYLLGTLSYQKSTQNYTYEFWEGDPLSETFLRITQQRLQDTFFEHVVFKTNSTQQEQVARALEIPYITQAQLIKEQHYLALNTGSATGQIHIIHSEQELTRIKPSDIIILKETPISLPPAAAIITEKPSTVLSHVNLLAKSWNVPNIYIKDASTILAHYNQQWVQLDALPANYQIKQIQPPKQAGQIPKSYAPPSTNLSETKLFPLQKLTTQDSMYCGSKAANLGHIKNRLPQAHVPDGFCIPFAQYEHFMQTHHFFKRLELYASLPFFDANILFKQTLLGILRQEIINTPVDPTVSAIWFNQWQTQLNSQAVFVRSSSNSEDLPNFNGAGLYTSVPHVSTTQSFEQAVKTVWASTLNYEAYETRRLMNLPHDFIKMGVLVQQSISADRSGVMITKDPFDPTRPYVTYIAAKHGIGIKVVEGKAVAEQVMYSSWSKAIQLITLSDEQTKLTTGEQDGVIEQPITPNDRVLNDKLIIRLAQLGNDIKHLFIYTQQGKKFYKDQDIEWAEKEGNIYILQARPYI